MLIACLVGNKKKKKTHTHTKMLHIFDDVGVNKITLHIFDDVGVAAAEL